jgi:hypothetical protein
MTPLRRQNLVSAGFFAAALLAFTGCSTGPAAGKADPLAEAYRSTWNVIATAGNEVTMQWESRAGATYGVYYTRDRSDRSSYRPLSGYSRIVGIGGQQTLKFQAPTAGQVYYRLLDYDSHERPARSSNQSRK